MSELKAIFWDQDGVIIDTEKDGHRVAFNKMFKAFGHDFEWEKMSGKYRKVSNNGRRLTYQFKTGKETSTWKFKLGKGEEHSKVKSIKLIRK